MQNIVIGPKQIENLDKEMRRLGILKDESKEESKKNWFEALKKVLDQRTHSRPS
jgi:hypothetical protein